MDLTCNRYKVLLPCYALVYFFCYGFYGFNNADDGYILAFSWRIFNGEVPYKDFILVKPPLSPLLHSLTIFLLPDNYQILAERLFFYVSMALSSLFGALTVASVFALDEIDIDPYLLATIGFVFSVNHFPPMPWQTVDGILFASCGIYLLTAFGNPSCVIVGVASLFLSALCKQSFYLMPLAGVLYIVIVSRDLKKSVVAGGSLAVCLAIFALLLYRFNILSDFLSFTSGSTKFRDLMEAGFDRYVNFPVYYFIIMLVVYIVLRRLRNNGTIEYDKILIPFLFIFLLLFKHLPKFLTRYFSNGNLDGYGDDVATVLFIMVMVFLIAEFSLERKWVSYCFLVLLSWCSGISWGYQTPVLFSVPLISGFFLISSRYFELVSVKKLAIFTLVAGTITYFIAYQKPYVSLDRRKLTYELSDVFPKMKHIKVDKDLYEQHRELKLLIAKYGHNFKTLPEMPLANYLSDTRSPICLDWIYNAETNFRNDKIIDELVTKGTTVFVAKQPQLITVNNTMHKFNSSVTYSVITTWRKIESTKYFDIYRFL